MRLTEEPQQSASYYKAQYRQLVVASMGLAPQSDVYPDTSQVEGLSVARFQQRSRAKRRRRQICWVYTLRNKDHTIIHPKAQSIPAQTFLDYGTRSMLVLQFWIRIISSPGSRTADSNELGGLVKLCTYIPVTNGLRTYVGWRLHRTIQKPSSYDPQTLLCRLSTIAHLPCQLSLVLGRRCTHWFA